MLGGLLTPDRGEVRVLGKKWEDDAAWIRARLGIQLQEAQLADKLTVTEALRLFRSFYREGPGVDELVATVELEGKRHGVGRHTTSP